ncbi:MAG TPA: hypothetical protein VKM94_10970 [Blastocatellia bacterium]|nr:hypothetical protein [Blastocatellia bacterium]
MSSLYVLRRANGNLFTHRLGDKEVIPVWSDRQSVDRYKERNPELMIFFPARVNQRMLVRLKSVSSSAEFFLLSSDDPSADLEDGRLVTPEEISMVVAPGAQTLTTGV